MLYHSPILVRYLLPGLLQMPEMADVAALNLSARYERQVLASAQQHGSASGNPNTVVPAIVITGFLGSGKTTLVRHLLRQTVCAARIAVLINEAGAVDVDSELAEIHQAHAAIGLSTVKGGSLAGGCVCCTAHGSLAASLAAVRQAAVAEGNRLDYLVIETSGVADAEPLAALLASHKFRLESVVTVVDAEIGRDALRGQPVAEAQVRCADIVLINKCDIASLGQVSYVEDEVTRLAPGVRTIRCRYSQVPADLLLDLQPPGTGDPQSQPSPTQTARQQPPPPVASLQDHHPPPSVHGCVGFLSHEPLFSAGPSGGGMHGTGSGVTQSMHHPVKRRAKLLVQHEASQPTNSHTPGSHAAHSPLQTQGVNSEHHAHLHAGYHTTVFTFSEAPIPLASFQTWLTHVSRTARGVLRVKGLVWVSELRRWRCVTHLSGRQRIECVREGEWVSPPRTQLVLIGTDLSELETLKQRLQEACTLGMAQGRLQPAGLSSQVPASPTQSTPAEGPPECSDLLQALVQAHPQLRASYVSSSSHQQGKDEEGREDNLLLELQVASDPLHGIDGGTVAATLMRRCNAAFLSSSPQGTSSGVLCIGVPQPPAISAVSGQVSGGADRMQALLFLHSTALVGVVEQLARIARSTLSAAFPSLGCKCDVVAALQSST